MRLIVCVREVSDRSDIAGHFVDGRDDEVDATTILVESA
jgi:hypothetical protein